ncbi:hypothetical protein BKA67DRAFT_525868 [Truncatella angustata]|uniref:CUE domain-containing protein n=1 Tax=Truncatella angustata TaxID=152316 RepID=A0A9P8RLX8_9PEZI|nr:uncharacterized protein BKA67DRAFT_525868 [Truncatella angustata]KAH6645780.1 hypothetical protein BKA67DRAFT_525868 [Truncatella angustata]
MISNPESPTTVKPFDMDDDDVQEAGFLGDDGTHQAPATSAGTSATAITAAPAATDEAAPPKPPRPMTETQKNEQILKEAFPSIDATVIKAVLVASGGRVDPAFNALLSMSDPDAIKDEPTEREAPPPPQPPRPTGRAPMSQMEADELYARQLAEHYDNAAYERRTQNRSPGQPGQPPYRRQATGLKPNEMYDREHSFIDDDLPVIKEQFRQGFLETQSKVNTWFTALKKRIDGEYDSEEDESQPSRRNQPGSSSRSAEAGRRSTDYDRYDADPQVLSDDFAGIRLNPDGTAPQGRPSNSNVYRPPPRSSPSPRPEGRKVAFKDGHDDIDDPYSVSPKLPPKDNTAAPSPGSKASKWQPMSAVDPNPIADHDPFSLGDSEDEKETKDKTSKDTKTDDNERLKQATADAMADSLVDDAKKGDAAK